MAGCQTSRPTIKSGRQDQPRRPSTVYEYGRSVKFFIDPLIGRRKVRDTRRRDIAELHHELRETSCQANWTLGVLSKMFNQAEV